jgi:general secretion pathway protein I
MVVARAVHPRMTRLPEPMVVARAVHPRMTRLPFSTVVARAGRPRTTRAPSAERGFTLIEVIVALAILSVAVVACIQGFAQGLRLLKVSGEHQRAALYADQKLREVVVPREGREEEQDAEAGFSWERTVSAVEIPELTTEPGQESPWRVWQIAVRVRWGERREVEVATLRTVSTAAEGETETVAPGTDGIAPRTGAGTSGSGTTGGITPRTGGGAQRSGTTPGGRGTTGTTPRSTTPSSRPSGRSP